MKSFKLLFIFTLFITSCKTHNCYSTKQVTYPQVESVNTNLSEQDRFAEWLGTLSEEEVMLIRDNLVYSRNQVDSLITLVKH
jgi:hypothetical protein